MEVVGLTHRPLSSRKTAPVSTGYEATLGLVARFDVFEKIKSINT